MEVVEDSEKSDEITTPTDPNVSLSTYFASCLTKLFYSHTMGLNQVSNSLKLISVIPKILIYCRCVCMSVFSVLNTNSLFSNLLVSYRQFNLINPFIISTHILI